MISCSWLVAGLAETKESMALLEDIVQVCARLAATALQ